FDLHLLELTAAEGVVPRVDFIAERLANLGDSERQLEAGAVEDVAEVDEDALGGFGTEVSNRGGVVQSPNIGLEHQVKRAGLCEMSDLAALRARNARARRSRNLSVRHDLVESLRKCTGSLA